MAHTMEHKRKLSHSLRSVCCQTRYSVTYMFTNRYDRYPEGHHLEPGPPSPCRRKRGRQLRLSKWVRLWLVVHWQAERLIAWYYLHQPLVILNTAIIWCRGIWWLHAFISATCKGLFLPLLNNPSKACVGAMPLGCMCSQLSLVCTWYAADSTACFCSINVFRWMWVCSSLEYRDACT